MTFGKREMTEMTLEVIIKRKHQGRVSDFYLGHIHRENSERKLPANKNEKNSDIFNNFALNCIVIQRGDS